MICKKPVCLGFVCLGLRKIKECKRSCVEMHALQEHLAKMEQEHVVKETKMESMNREVRKLRTKTWADICNGNGVQEGIDVQETKGIDMQECQNVKSLQRMSS